MLSKLQVKNCTKKKKKKHSETCVFISKFQIIILTEVISLRNRKFVFT